MHGGDQENLKRYEVSKAKIRKSDLEVWSSAMSAVEERLGKQWELKKGKAWQEKFKASSFLLSKEL